MCTVETINPASALAGGVCVAIADLVMHPVDTLKTRFQAGEMGPRGFKALLDRESYKGIFSGIKANLISLPGFFVYFWVYENSKALFDPYCKQDSHVFFSHVVASSLGEVTSIVVR